jgi:hypothetical protein
MKKSQNMPVQERVLTQHERKGNAMNLLEKSVINMT